MKTKACLTLFTLFFGVLLARCQGTFLYDQQSSTNEVPTGFDPNIQSNEPIGQSFVPTLDSVGFVRLFVSDSIVPTGSPATIYVNLLSGSITGAVLGATSPLALPGGYSSYTTFFFSAPVNVTPGTTYYFQIVANSADEWITRLIPVLNFNGTAYLNGSSFGSGLDQLWFREGIVVPEPSLPLLALSGTALFCARRKKTNLGRGSGNNAVAGR